MEGRQTAGGRPSSLLGRSTPRIGEAIEGARRRVAGLLPRWLVGPLANPLVHASIVLAALIVWAVNAPPLSYDLYLAQLVCVYAIAALGLNIPSGLGGALSLGHGAAFALGVYATGIMAVDHGWPVWLTLPFATAIGLVAGLAMGGPAVRLGVLALAMVTLGWVLVVNDMILELDEITGGSGGLIGIQMRTSFDGIWVDPVVIPILIFAIGWLTYLGHWWYRSSHAGRAALAARDDAVGASASGISSYRVRLETFAIGSAIGALAGGLFAYLSQTVTPASVSPALSILFLAMIILGGSGSRVGPVVGAVILTLVPNWLSDYPHVNSFVYGGLLILTMLLLPRGIMGSGRPSRPRPLAGLVAHDALAEADPDEERAPAAGTEVVLRLRDVSRSFGEVKALEDVDFEVRAGEIVGLVGPNGSGKTTLINVASGMYPAEAGTVELCGRNITRTAPHRIARAGLARTFQTPKVFPSLSIGEHLALASRDELRADPGGTERTAATAAALLAMGGLDASDPAVLERPVAALAQGQLRFLEVAMAALHSPRVLLLDEPATGLSAAEMDGLERAAAVLARQGTGVVIVEHHLDLIRRLVDRVVVLNLGRVLWKGDPAELDAAEDVRVAYLGIEQ